MRGVLRIVIAAGYVVWSVLGAPGQAGAASLLNRVFTKSEPASDCRVPAPADYFTPADSFMFVWFDAADMRAGDAPAIAWTMPSGRSDRATVPSGSGRRCSWVRLGLKGLASQDLLGDWTFRFQVNQANVGDPATTVVLGSYQPRIDSVQVLSNGSLERLSPGTWALVLGANLATAGYARSGDNLPTASAGVTVTINGIPAPLAAANGSQVVVQVPTGIQADSAVIRAFTGWGGSNLYRAPLTAVSPAVLPSDGDPRQASVLRLGTDGSSGWVSSVFPLRRGDLATVQAVGLGPVFHAPPDGALAVKDTDTFFAPQVTVGGVNVRVRRTALADFPGLYWVTVEIPPEVPSGGSVPLRLSVNGVAANVMAVPIAGPAPGFSAPVVSRVEHPSWNGTSRDNGVYNAAGLVTITASNLRPNAPGFIQCSSPDGFKATSPVVTLSTSAATAIVPPYIDPRTGNYAAGSVSCVLGQTLGDQVVTSGTFSFRIQAPPMAPGAPGTLTLATIQAGAQGAQRVHANLTLKDRAAGGRFSAANTRAEMGALVAAYAPYVDAIRRISSGTATAVTIGVSPTGKALTITRDGLARTDRWLAMILAEARASTEQNENYLPQAENGQRGLIRPASALGTIVGWGTRCVNVFDWISYAGSAGPNPNQYCSAFRSAVGSIPAAAGESLYEAAQAVKQDIERFSTTAKVVVIAGLAPEAEVTAVMARMGAVAAAAEAGAAFVGHVLVAASPYVDGDRQAAINKLSEGWHTPVSDWVMDKVDDGLQKGLQVFFGSDGPEAYNFGKQAMSMVQKVGANLDEMRAPQVVRNADGSYSLSGASLPGAINVISGQITQANRQPVADGYGELGDGGALTPAIASGATNPDGSFEMLVPANQVGKTIPATTQVLYNIPRSGSPGYQVVTGNSVATGRSTTIPPAVVDANGGGGGGGGGGNPPSCSAGSSACRAD